MKDILLFVDNYRDWKRSAQYACEFTTTFDANLSAAFVVEPIVPLPSMSLPAPLLDYYAMTADVRRDACAAEPDFRRWAKRFGVNDPHWLVAQGHVSSALAHAAIWNDLLVLGSGGESPWTMPSQVGQILLTCGVPCLVVPETLQRKAAARRIVIAWNGSIEAMRTVHSALPLLQKAEHILLIESKRDNTFAVLEWAPPFALGNYLERHSVHVKKTTINAPDASAGEHLLRLGDEFSADLLVMGAYGRTRLSEWILGGATRHVLTHSKIPLFMQH